MNVIPFPLNAHLYIPEEPHGPVVLLTCAIRVIGEPARTDEMLRLIASVTDMTPHLEARLLAILGGGTQIAYGVQFAFELFRGVELDGDVAWAFTAEYRRQLSDRGLLAPLRATAESAPQSQLTAALRRLMGSTILDYGM